VPKASSPGGSGSANLPSEFNKAEGGDIWFALDNARLLACFAGAQAEAANLGSSFPRIQSAFRPVPIILKTSITHDSNFVF
jgi:hypothetical protein